MKASVATVILAFCASNAIAAPGNNAFEKRDPVLPLAAKVGIKAGAQLGKELFFDEKRDVQDVEKREPVLPIAAKVGIKAGAMLGKKLFFDEEKRDVEKREPVLPIAAKVGIKAGAMLGKKLFFDEEKRDLEAVEKRDPVLPIAAKVGVKAGAMLGKKLFFDEEKRDVDERDAFIEFKPFDDDPFNPFDDPGVIGKREAQGGFKEGLNNAIQWWAKEVSDDSPMNPFDDPGLPGKREAKPFIGDVLGKVLPQDKNDDTSFNPLDGKLDILKREADPQGGFKEGLNNAIQWWAKEVSDDSPMNPFDDPGLPGKREAKPFIGDVLNKVIPQDKNDDTSFNPLDGKLNIFKA